ncbi:7196_t:CDS:2 [Acaulospora morrowiae]|uniref:7196_t:CDS:1 n=1 Tax=Acaulospora morrowiae TaxID=94023 RepID=A0A9N8W421_9GLOM|nr:7196_t:CDS:2 [Acaulospora morrowiae]
MVRVIKTEQNTKSSNINENDKYPVYQTQVENTQIDIDSSEKLQSPIWDKYNLHEFGDDHDEEKNNDEILEDKSKKKHMSAKERRLLKKNVQSGNGSNDILPGPFVASSSGTSVVISQEQKSSNKKQVKSTSTPRGKKGKMKKLKDKYADQDEEERSLRMELLGSSKAPQQKGKKGKKESSSLVAPKQSNDSGKDETKKKEIIRDNANDDSTHNQEGLENNNLVDDIENEEDAEEVRQLLREENIIVLEAEELENLTVLDFLTGTPLPDDILLFAVPVCAPYISLQKYKYKVKLTPGAMKKGKACKMATNFFLHDPTITPREKELIKSVPDTEMISVMIGKCKVSAPNIELSKKVARKQKTFAKRQE